MPIIYYRWGSQLMMVRDLQPNMPGKEGWQPIEPGDVCWEDD
ncbi:hypothetical protein NXU92_22360 [Bacteroides fragilis]|nr:hypothetical protein [Bacteroides fragilis]